MVEKKIWKFKDVDYNSAPANFKQTVWQSCSVGALFQHLASLNTFQKETWESFPSIAFKQLSVHHFNRLEVSSCSSRKNGLLAGGNNWQQSTHAIDYWLNCVPAISWQDMFLCVRKQLRKCLFNYSVCVVRIHLNSRLSLSKTVPIVAKYSLTDQSIVLTK